MHCKAQTVQQIMNLSLCDCMVAVARVVLSGYTLNLMLVHSEQAVYYRISYINTLWQTKVKTVEKLTK